MADGKWQMAEKSPVKAEAEPRLGSASQAKIQANRT
jgi:hypothetical protein